MPRRRNPRPDTISCRSCGAEVVVGERGVIPSLCVGCRQAVKIGTLLDVIEEIPVGVEATRLAKKMNAARMRLLRRV